jgi:flagellar biogenesis protein FliO
MKTSRTKALSAASDHTSPFPVIADDVSLSTLRPPTGLLSRAWKWMQARQRARSTTRRLRVAETVSLGEKRFVAVVQVDGRHFLLAGGPTNIALLAQLDDKEPFEAVLKKTMTALPKPPAKRKHPAKRPDNRAHFNGTEAFGNVLEKTMNNTGKQSARQGSKQNARAATPRTEHYA